MKDTIRKREYGVFLAALKGQIRSARKEAYQTVNRQLVELYLCLGEAIYEKVEISRWGAGIVERLARDLQMEFPDMRGLSAQNLWRMKQIYEVYRDYPILSPLVRELPWTHNTVILHTKEKNTLVHFKDEYVFDFLGLKDDFAEKELRRAGHTQPDHARLLNLVPGTCLAPGFYERKSKLALQNLT